MQITSDAGRRMLLQILTHARSVNRNWYAMFRKMRAWPDAALHEDHRALECPRGNNDLAGRDRNALIVSYQTAAVDPSVHDGKALEQRIRENGQIWPTTNLGGQIRQGGTGTAAVLIQIDRGRKYAVEPGAALVVLFCIT